MRKTPILIINNLLGADTAIKLDNFKDIAVREAVGKLIKVEPDDLTCLQANVNSGAYGIKNKHLYPHLENTLQRTIKIYPEYKFVVSMSYGNLVE